MMKMAELSLDSIKVGERFRKDMGDIEGLAHSIKEKGLLQPITVDLHYNLVAGGRRLAAARLAGVTTIPCVIRKITDELDFREIELYENIHRKDMLWWERAKLEKLIFDMHLTKDPSWSLR